MFKFLSLNNYYYINFFLYKIDKFLRLLFLLFIVNILNYDFIGFNLATLFNDINAFVLGVLEGEYKLTNL